MTRPPDHQGPRRRRQRASTAALAAVLVLAVLALAVPAWLWLSPGAQVSWEKRLRAGGVVEISATTNQIRRAIQLPGSNDIELGMDAAWVTAPVQGGAGVARLDLSLTRRIRPIALASDTAAIPDDLAVGAGALWVILPDGVYRVDPARPTEARKVPDLPVQSLLRGVAVGAGAVWVVDATRGMLSRISPAKGSVTNVIPLGTPAESVAVGEGAIWVTSTRTASVLKISPTLMRVVRAVQLGSAPSGIAVGAGSIWVTASERNEIARIDPASNRVTWIAVDDGPTGVSVTGRTVWVANSKAGTVSRIDADRGEVVAGLRVPSRPYRIAADQHTVWVTALGRPLPHDHAQPATTAP